jgi:predicted transcriptional regulator
LIVCRRRILLRLLPRLLLYLLLLCLLLLCLLLLLLLLWLLLLWLHLSYIRKILQLLCRHRPQRKKQCVPLFTLTDRTP